MKETVKIKKLSLKTTISSVEGVNCESGNPHLYFITVVGDNINTMKTTFECNFDLN